MSGLTLTMRLSHGPKREMTVAYAPGENTQRPMIRIANKFLTESGFTVGTKIEAEYGPGVNTITKKLS